MNERHSGQGGRAALVSWGHREDLVAREEGKPPKGAEENLFSYFNWSSLAAEWRV